MEFEMIHNGKENVHLWESQRRGRRDEAKVAAKDW